MRFEIWRRGCAGAMMMMMITHVLFFSLFVSLALFLAAKQMKSSDIDQELFTESYCKVCSAQLISESQRVAHYEVRGLKFL